MSFQVVSSLIFTKKRKAMQLFPESVRDVWNDWELPAVVLISLIFQSILVLLGNWRKHSTSNTVRIFLWLTYLSSDAIATVSLGILSRSQQDCEDDAKSRANFVISSLWAPFLLLHLGGPDTITAYSLEDNELWMRHLLGLVVQVCVAFYIFFRAWSNEMLNFLAIPMFIVGIIKFGERTWVLRSASNEHFRDSMLRDPDPGPNYARYMEEYSSKRSEGFRVQLGTFIEAPLVEDHLDSAAANDDNQIDPSLTKAFEFSETFKLLCADLILSFHDIVTSQSFFHHTICEEAFKVIEFELGFIYDMFYAKAVLICSRLGLILRCITISLTVSVFIAFIFTKKKAYKPMDVNITYVLLLGAIILEIVAVVRLLTSDWTMLWLSKHKNMVVDLLGRAVSSIPSVRNRRWSNKMGQYNLITFCRKARPAKCNFLKKDLFLNRLLERYRYRDFTGVSKGLKQLIFVQLQEKSRIAPNFEACKRLCARRGDQVLEKANCVDKLGWAITGVEFDHSILLWHIATDLCYHSDINNRNLVPDSKPNWEAGKLLSNYMLYLLVMCPFMLPNGIAQIRFRDTCAEAEKFLREQRVSKTEANKACTKLYDVCTDILPSTMKGDRSKSVLFDASRLARLCRPWSPRKSGS